MCCSFFALLEVPYAQQAVICPMAELSRMLGRQGSPANIKPAVIV
jgi:hypothetical protein